MTTISLTRTETSILQTAACEGRLRFAPEMKPASRKRLIGRLLRDDLITPSDAPDGQHRLTPTGYLAIGLTPPARTNTACRPNKKVLVLTLLTRDNGATLAELIAATGWLPHTTRAALSDPVRGQPLAKAARPDATTAYRILPPSPAARTRSRRKRETLTRGAEAEPQAGMPIPAVA
ncbi:DUF3489 domain-containing protein [Methylobacterium sp. WL1]|uniref:DUF3489 domain-containing protein n=1 Tax=Methylobacterium sp. WL1 TaxID=2603276 RepID=UPI0011C1DAE0|nr:DUF3489 domain-containing protein [Methylobacterium sp. WL1]QEE41700.1 DUF3489 domain-containing protein [Methylobacterium sp. WL1]